MPETAKSGDSTLKQLASDEPQRHDVFIGIVAPIGSSRREMLSALAERLSLYDYAMEPIHLADLLGTIPTGSKLPLPDRSSPNYYQARMDAGDRIRKRAGDPSALAGVAIARAAKLRSERKAGASKPIAYVFDSLKHPREAQLLRSVYGSAFWLISIVQDISERKQNLTDELGRQHGTFDQVPEARAVELISRDEADPTVGHGQHVRDVFSAADFYVPIRRGVEWQEGIDRFLGGVFNAPFLTPTVSEEAMRHARAASLRSAAIGRQVGAVIVPKLGTPFLLGTNEVPKPGGGQYREGDSPDHRDFQSGSDPNPMYTERVLREVFDRLAKANYFSDERNAAGGASVMREALREDADGHAVLDGARVRSLIEFTRCLHAEQAAIVNAARSGVAIDMGRLYTTTFPCHECTKFIVGAGIVEVQYIEPYPKSLAADLYRDLIDAVPPMEEVSEDVARTGKVPFRPFLGFGPSRYDEVFEAGSRREGTAVATHVLAEARPIGRGWNEVGVRSKEDEVVVAVAEAAKRLSDEQVSMPPTTDAQQEDGPTQRSQGAS